VCVVSRRVACRLFFHAHAALRHRPQSRLATKTPSRLRESVSHGEVVVDAQLTDETRNGQRNTGIELWPPEVSGSSSTQHEWLPGRAGKEEDS
jgi:hypothetical protein